MPTNDFAGPAWRDHGQVHRRRRPRRGLRGGRHVRRRARRGADRGAAARPSSRCSNYGALFLGEGTCVSYGDKVIGTNHVLPTRGAARYTGGLWVGKYLKTVTYQEVTDEASSAALGDLCGRAVRVELFEGHARSGDVRAAKFGGTALEWAPRRSELRPMTSDAPTRSPDARRSSPAAATASAGDRTRPRRRRRRLIVTGGRGATLDAVAAELADAGDACRRTSAIVCLRPTSVAARGRLPIDEVSILVNNAGVAGPVAARRDRRRRVGRGVRRQRPRGLPDVPGVPAADDRAGAAT